MSRRLKTQFARGSSHCSPLRLKKLSTLQRPLDLPERIHMALAEAVCESKGLTNNDEEGVDDVEGLKRFFTKVGPKGLPTVFINDRP